MSTLNLKQIVTGTIESIAFGGHGILRHDNFVVFVPFTAPGETISAEIVQVKKSHAIAKLISVITPSPKRVSPKCSHYGRCGGCQLQHISPDAQDAAKRQFAIDALTRIAKLSPAPEVHYHAAQNKWAYRRHVRLQVRPGGATPQIGYYDVDNQFLPIQECPIFMDNPAALQRISNLLPNESGEIIVVKSGDELVLDYRGEKSFSAAQKPIDYHFAGLDFQFTPRVFMQNNTEQSEAIYRHVLSIFSTFSSKHILDLYCGIGITSLMLSKLSNVTGIESNEKSIELAKRHSTRNNIKNVLFSAATVEKFMNDINAPKFDAVLVNPPRTGLSQQVVNALLRDKPKNIVYVSCMPSTLARDIAKLKEIYDVKSCHVFDMFPQTYHVETVVHLQR